MIWTLFFLTLTVLWIILGTTKFKLHPFFVLLYAAIGLGILAQIPAKDLIPLIARGFGKTFESIGLLIVFGTLIGAYLEQSGATQSIARSLLKNLSRLPLPYAISAIGYIVAIPVFCDSAFVILSTLNKTLAQESNTPRLAPYHRFIHQSFCPTCFSSSHARTVSGRSTTRITKPRFTNFTWGISGANIGPGRGYLCAVSGQKH